MFECMTLFLLLRFHALVQFVEVLLVLGRKLWALVLKCWGHAFVLYSESLAKFVHGCFEQAVFDELVSLELIPLQNVLQFSEHCFLEVRQVCNRSKITTLRSMIMRIRPRFCSRNVWHNNRDQAILKRASVHPDLAHQRCLGILLLKCLRTNIFALGKLEQVLLPVNNRERAIVRIIIPLCNIAGSEPAIRNRFARRLLIFEVPVRNHLALEP
mmetsp:Transcript_2312/g.5208  ORF Transcript_2312/g.5208 Transcript_2312/m.5208 type:complete len:213 (-) Transcript_2312:1459-2097(-)